MAQNAGNLSWLSLAVLGGAIIAWPSACTTDATPMPASHAQADLVEDILTSLAQDVIIPRQAEALSAAVTLRDTLQHWSDALETDSADAARADTHAAWRELMAAWQPLELMQVGPAGDPLVVAGGEDLRNEIYSWPSDNHCRVDQETVAQDYVRADYFDDVMVTSYGLDALEYLLFAEGDKHDCPTQVQLNADGAWDSLVGAGLDRARAQHALALAERLVVDIDALSEAWEGGFLEQFQIGPAQDSLIYRSQGDALTAAFHAMFYLESQTKDRKLAMPLGLQGCAKELCPEEIESRLAQASMTNIQGNLEGFRAMFFGAENGPGFDDLLIQQGHQDLVVALDEAITAASEAASAVQAPLSIALEQEHEAVLTVHEQVKAITDLLKGDISTALLLQIPNELAGDND